MIKRFGLLFALLVILELAGLIFVGKVIGVLPTIGLVILTIVIGLFILKRQKLTALEPMMKAMQTGQPATTLPNVNFCAFVAGILLIIPGFISDSVGLCLLIPWVQKKIFSKYVSAISRNSNVKSSTRQATIIQGDFKKKKADNDL